MPVRDGGEGQAGRAPLSAGDPHQELRQLKRVKCDGMRQRLGETPSPEFCGVSAAAVYLPLPKGGDRGTWQKLVNNFFFSESI